MMLTEDLCSFDGGEEKQLDSRATSSDTGQCKYVHTRGERVYVLGSFFMNAS